MGRTRTTRQTARRHAFAIALALVAGTAGSTGVALLGCGSGDDTSAGPGSDASVLDGFPLPIGVDGGADSGPGRGCGPSGAVASAPTYLFVGPDAGGCNVAQIDALSVDCLESDGSDASAAACSAFLASATNAACLGCVYGPAGPSGSGGGSDTPNLQRPLYTVDFPTGSTNGIVFASVGGCIAAVAPTEQGCAQAVTAATDCETAQCGGCGLDLDAGAAPVGDAAADAATFVPGAYDLINDCIAAAAVGPCADLETQSLDCTTRLFAADAGPVRTCGDLVSTGGTLTADLTSYLYVACGGGPETVDSGASSDAGKDGGK